MKKLSLIALAAAVAISSAAAKEIKIGVVLPITGAVAAYGQTAWAGIKLANKLEPTLKNGDNETSDNQHLRFEARYNF